MMFSSFTSQTRSWLPVPGSFFGGIVSTQLRPQSSLSPIHSFIHSYTFAALASPSQSEVYCSTSSTLRDIKVNPISHFHLLFHFSLCGWIHKPFEKKKHLWDYLFKKLFILNYDKNNFYYFLHFSYSLSYKTLWF